MLVSKPPFLLAQLESSIQVLRIIPPHPLKSAPRTTLNLRRPTPNTSASGIEPPLDAQSLSESLCVGVPKEKESI
jgi:hypothetical protein